MEVHVEIAAETLFKIGPLEVTNSLATMLGVMALLIFFGWLVARKAQVKPESKGQSVFEVIVEFLLGLVEGTAGKKGGRRIFPLIGGIFIFILLANYSGLLPGVGTIGFYREEEASHEEPAGEEEGDHAAAPVYEVASVGQTDSVAPQANAEEGHKVLVPFLRAPNADLNMTLAMALVTFIVVQIAGIKAHGVGGRIKHMANPPFLFPIEVISEFSRIISLSARLFGNVFAGEVLLGVMYAMAAAIKIAVIPVLFPVIFIGLELLFGGIQALVFALLTLIYIAQATAGGHDDHEEEGHGEHAHGTAGVSTAASH
jgi:F-type H+-transporting ATPase subunit a